MQQIRSYSHLLIALGMWLFLCCGYFYPAVVGGKVIAPLDCLDSFFRPFATQPLENVHNHFVSDGVSQYLPYKWAIKTSCEEDGYVGWDPYTFNGRPISNNTMASPGDPWNMVYAVLPFWTAWNWGIIVQFLIAGCGMILLLRHYKLPIWAVLLAAISFSFYSQYVLWMYHKWLGAMIWSPYLVWALLKYRNVIVNIPAIIFMALLWRTGSLQTCLFGFLLVSFVWCAVIWKKNEGEYSWKECLRVTGSYLLTGSVGALLSLDVFVDTLANVGGCKDMGFSWGVNNIPTFVTLLFPTVLGVPETLDIAKVLRLDLFDIKFGGGVVFLLSVIACFNSRAPRVAKILFLLSIVAVCTPLLAYIYSRSTLIMSLGMSWLAAWQLYDLTRVRFKSAHWNRIIYALVSVSLLWLLASVAVVCFKELLAQQLTDVMNSAAATSRPGRIAWQELRVERFLSQILIWNWRNAILLVCLFLGVWFCRKIKPGQNNSYWMAGVTLTTFVELFVFSGVWVTYSQKPESAHLYATPDWVEELSSHVGDGSVAVFSPSADNDFLCENHLASYGIRMAFGYETFIPECMAPLNWTSTQLNSCVIRPMYCDQCDPDDYALAGISHILSYTRWNDVPVSGWNLVMTGNEFKVYANPKYRGRYLLDEGRAIKENWRTSNRINLTIPAHSGKLMVLESYHQGWSAVANGENLLITPTERGGMLIELPESERDYELLLEFRMPYRMWYYSIMSLTACVLLLIFIKQKKQSNTSYVR